MSCRESFIIWLYLQTGVCIKWKKKCFINSVYTHTPIHSFLEIDPEIFCMVILFLLLIQEGQFSVSCKRMCTGTGQLLTKPFQEKVW